MNVPRKAGYYWAKWITADRSTKDGSLLTPSDDWDVIYVYENGMYRTEGEFLRALVVGVEGSQSIDNFEWGPGPLTPPGDLAFSTREEVIHEGRQSEVSIESH